MEFNINISRELNHINNLLKKNFSYKVEVPSKGTYVCMSNNTDDIRSPKAIQHDELCEYLKKPKDFAIWIPSDNLGWNSPWGKGTPSANLYVLLLNA